MWCFLAINSSSARLRCESIGVVDIVRGYGDLGYPGSLIGNGGSNQLVGLSRHLDVRYEVITGPDGRRQVLPGYTQ